MSTYWKIAVEESLGEHGIKATPEQIEAVANDMMRAHEMEGEATGRCFIANPLDEEVRKLKAALKKTEELSKCPLCYGEGTIWSERLGRRTCQRCGGNKWVLTISL